MAIKTVLDDRGIVLVNNASGQTLNGPVLINNNLTLSSDSGLYSPDGTTVITFGDYDSVWTNEACYYAPIGGTSDDWAPLFATSGLASQCVTAGKVLVLTSGTYRCDTIQSVPSGLHLLANNSVTIVSTLTPTGTPPYPSVFRHNGINEPLLTTTLSSTASVGNLTINTVATGSVGSEIWIQDATSANQAASYIVTAISGTSPTTLTLDRPIKRPFALGSAVKVIRRASNITLDGRGAYISGSFDRAFNFPAAVNVRIINWNVDARPDSTEYACSIDTASYCSGFERIRVNSGPATGLALEGCEDCWAEDCHITHGGTVSRTNCGILLQAAVDTELRNCHSSGRTGASGCGILVGWLTDTVACRGVRLVGCSFVGNLNGIQVGGGSNDVDVIGCNISGNTQYGVYSATATGPTRLPGRIRVIGGEIRNNAGIGFYADGTIGHKIISTYLYENVGNIATINGGEITADGVESYQSTLFGYHFKTNSANDVIAVSNSTFRGTNTGVGYGCWVANGSMSATGIKFDFANGSMVACVQTGGTCYVADWKNIGAVIASGFLSSAGTVRRGPNCSFASCTTPWSVSGQANFGTVTLNGATPVALLWSPIIAADVILTNRASLGGTPAPFQAVVSASYGVIVTGTAGDTSNVNIFVI